MLHRMMAAAFQNVKETDDIRVDIGPGIVDAVTHAGLGRQVDDQLRLKLRKNLLHRRRVDGDRQHCVEVVWRLDSDDRNAIVSSWTPEMVAQLGSQPETRH